MKKYKTLLFTLGFVFLILAFVFAPFLIRPESTLGHFDAWSLGVRTFIENPLGLGLGQVGPASHWLETGPLIPESWYLQVLAQLSLPGLVLFLGIMGVLLKNLVHKKAVFHGAALISMLVVALFLHPFEDTPGTYLLFSLIALELPLQQKANLQK